MRETIPPRFRKNDVLSLFPTFVWRSQLAEDTYGPINRKLLALLERLTEGFAAAPGAKLQTEQHLDRMPEMTELNQVVAQAVESILGFLKIDHSGFVTTGCWANIGTPGSPHKMHSHPNNFLSAVYYVTAPDGGNVISFHDPRPQRAVISPSPREMSAENAGKADLTVGQGDLVVFPSWLFHSVPPNTSEQNRISIAFNFMFRQFEEVISPPGWKGRVKLDD